MNKDKFVKFRYKTKLLYDFSMLHVCNHRSPSTLAYFYSTPPTTKKKELFYLQK